MIEMKCRKKKCKLKHEHFLRQVEIVTSYKISCHARKHIITNKIMARIIGSR